MDNLADSIEHIEEGDECTTHLRITRLFRLARCLAWDCSCGFGFGFARFGFFTAIGILGCVSPELANLQGMHQ